MFLFAPRKGQRTPFVRDFAQAFILALGIALVRYSAVSGN
jgi:hypothetical protein